MKTTSNNSKSFLTCQSVLSTECLEIKTQNNRTGLEKVFKTTNLEI